MQVQPKHNTMAYGSRGQIRVLHVDDDSDITDLTATFLERENDRISVETAHSPNEGLEKTNDRPPDCVVSDYNMPGMDGIEFLRKVREDHPNLPFIIFTAKGSEAVASEAISAGVTDYLQKSPGSEQYEILANRIGNAVQRRREKKRADRQEKLMRVTELAGDTGGFEVNVETGEVLMTDGTRRLVGLPEDAELSVEEAIDFYHPDDQADVRRAINKTAETDKQTRNTWRLRTQDEEERLVEVTITPGTTDGDGDTLRGAVRDVTDIKKRQQELRRLQQAIDDANVPITLADPSKEGEPLVYVNSSFEELTGYSPKEAVGRNCRFLQGEGTDPEKVEKVRKAIENGEQVTVELRNYRKDGTEFWNRLTVTPIYDDGELVRYLGTQKDVTERRKKRQELRSERRFIEQALNTLDDTFYVLDTDGTFRRWNDKVPEVTGYTDQELPEMQAIELFPKDEREAIAEAIETTLEEGRATVEADLRSADGERIPHEFTGARLTDEDGDVTGLVGVGRDLTEQRLRERRFQALVEGSNDIISVVDDEGVVQYQSPSIERILGYDPGDTVEHKAWEYVHPEDRSDLIEAFERGLMNPDAHPVIEYRARHDDGSWRWLEARGNNQLGNPAVEGYIVNSREITTRKEREDELKRQNERLEEFTSVVSHDLRNPLQVAYGRLALIQEENENVEAAIQALDRMGALIENLLTLAQEGNEVGEVEPVVLADVVKDCWQNVSTTEAEIVTDYDRTIRADRTRLQQLLENLLGNSIEHGGEDVTVSVGTTEDGFYVADTGPGIPEGDREEVFEAGYSTNEGGTGFGLRIVNQVAEAHGWEVTVTESDTGGARFEFTDVGFVDM